MAEPKYDVAFAGELRGAADIEHVKLRLGEMFKLGQAGIDRLFSGHQVFIKRGVDRPTAERFRDAFYKAGAVVDLVPVAEADQGPIRFDDSDAATDAEPDAAAEADVAAGAGQDSVAAAPDRQTVQDWSVAPVGAPLEELSDLGPEQHPDTSQLSLVEQPDWSLEDCAPPPLAQPIPDIDSLELEPIAERADSGDDDER